ncbi:hypothetical protein AB1207_03995 [Kineococcus endophyticus]|uniref:Mce-associated membrane protein n=1 Tax=Kineococcus endophyticus TaxID=1181883 RepID=A0ABV3P2Q6_9ACTN
MRFLHGAVGLVTVVAGPLLLTSASAFPRPTPVTSERCFGGAVYESISGSPDAHQLFEEYLRGARSTLEDLHVRAPQLTDDPYFSGILSRAEGDVEAFTALSEVTRATPRPPVDQPLRAVDADGRLIAEVRFSSWIFDEQGSYAIDSATLPDPGRDPAEGCRQRTTR